jgi:GntR family transcriptional regulator
MMSIMKTSSALPLYAVVEGEIASSIANGTFPIGHQLPTEDELIQRFSVSRTTVRKAIENLSARGLVEIRRGTGTFVAQPKIVQEMTELTGFVEDMDALGLIATARVIDHAIVAADADVARHLALNAGASVMRIRRVRIASGVALSLDETYLPCDIGEKIVSHDLAAEPIFKLLEQRYDIPLIEAEYTLEATAASDAIAAALSVAAGSPIFLIERTSHTLDNRPVDYERLHYRGDLIRFRTRLARRKPAGN